MKTLLANVKHRLRYRPPADLPEALRRQLLCGLVLGLLAPFLMMFSWVALLGFRIPDFWFAAFYVTMAVMILPAIWLVERLARAERRLATNLVSSAFLGAGAGVDAQER